MNTFEYLVAVVRDELIALKAEVKESKGLAIIFLLAVISLVIYLKPFPERQVYFATYYPSSDWSELAVSPANILKKAGIDVSVIYTDGAVDNVIRLDDPKNKANAGFTYGAALDQGQVEGIYSLGSVVYEPIWIFYRKNKAGRAGDLSGLAKLRVGLGPSKSGSYAIAKKIFSSIHIDIDKSPNFYPDEILSNQAKLKNGEIDALIFVSTILDPTTQNLLRDPGLAIFDAKNAQAYEKQFNSFVTLTLPADSVDIYEHIPKRDISLIATTTSLVVKRSMHPDLQLAILMAARDANRESRRLFFAKRDEFPAYMDPTIPISPVAQHFYDYGAPHGVRYLPYWLAGLIERAWLLILTVLALIYPLSKLVVHLRKYRYTLHELPYYKELLAIEMRLCEGNLTGQEKLEVLGELERINTSAIQFGVPIGEEASYFSLLAAINGLRAKVKEAQGAQC